MDRQQALAETEAELEDADQRALNAALNAAQALNEGNRSEARLHARGLLDDLKEARNLAVEAHEHAGCLE